MIVILLIIIACALLFGADKTKNGISNIIIYGLLLICIMSMLGSYMN